MFCGGGGVQIREEGSKSASGYGPGGPNPRGVQIRCDTARTGRFFFFIQPIKSLISGVVVAVAVVVT